MPTDINKICEELSSLTVLEISQLSKALQEKWGIDMSAYAASAQPTSSSAPAQVADEKKSFDVILEGAGESKINVIKEVRAVTGLGLKEAKDLVDGAPKPVKQGVSKEEAEKIKVQLESAGAKVAVK